MTLPLWSSGALSGFQPDGSLSSYTKPVFLSLSSTAALLNSSVRSLQGDLHRSGGNTGVTDTQTNQKMETTGVPSHSPPAGGSGQESYHQDIAAEQGGCGKAKVRGHHLLFIPLFLFLFSGWNLDAHSHVLNRRHGGLSYMHMHTLIQLSSGSVKPLVNTCLFSPRRCWVRIRRRR